MSKEYLKWQAAVREQFDTETASNYIETISGLLEDRSSDVLRLFASELVLNLREIRQLAQKIQQTSDPQVKAMGVFKTIEAGEEKTVNLEQFSQMIVDHVAESRQLVDILSFYAMALADQKTTP
jgi:hypothetical protein